MNWEDSPTTTKTFLHEELRISNHGPDAKGFYLRMKKMGRDEATRSVIDPRSRLMFQWVFERDVG